MNYILEKLMSYVKPESLTFWSGMVLIGTGAVQLLGSCGIDCGSFGAIADGLFGTDGAGMRIAMGSGMIGLRRAIGAV